MSALSETIARDQHDCDHVSFFVDGKIFEELSPMDISKHNCLHLVNVIEKLTRCLEDPLPDDSGAAEKLLADEVIPDLVVYALQIASAHKIQWLLSYRDLLQPTYHQAADAAQSLHDLVLLQARVDQDAARIVPAVASARRAIIGAGAFLARICDKDDHGTELPRDEIESRVSSVLLREGLRLALFVHRNLDHLYTRRLEEIKKKYGNVRILLGKE